MPRWKSLFCVPLFCVATLAAAQVPAARVADPVFVRAQTLVSDGNGVAGRALIDSVIAATSPTARLYPEALFWRASLAANAADAESDYKHIVVDYPLAPQAEDALLRLAQLELARGDRDGALGHLQRIPRDYPRSKSLARASYWTARVLFEKNDIPNACVANANALAQADASEVELKNQIQYQGQRCPSAAAVAAVSSPAAGVTANTPAISVTAPAVPSGNSASTSSPSSAPPTSVTPPEKQKPAVIETASPAATASSAPKTVVQAPRPKPPAEANDSKPSGVDPAKAPKAAVEKVAAKPTAAVEKVATKPSATVSHRSGYSIQVAAYKHKPEADKLAAALSKRGYSVQVDGSVTPWFRVRIGRYATEKEAEDALRKVKANHMEGFVVRASER
jgi:cell division protein FtsN